MDPDADAWRWATPAESIHMVPEGHVTSLCGQQCPEDTQRPASNYHGLPVPYMEGPVCSTCEGIFGGRAQDELGHEMDDLAVGDIVRFWNRDPSTREDAYHITRNLGVVAEKPPLEGEAFSDDLQRVRIRTGPMINHVIAPRHVYEVQDDRDAEDVLDSGSKLGKAAARVLNESGR